MIELIDLYIKIYHENKDKFFSLHSGVAVTLLSELYTKFLNDSNITPIDAIRPEKYKEYEIVAQTHIKEGRKEIDIIKSAYALELITSTY